uniref:Uncharacterized protein n=1 Tax=Parascaris univalens TaxID=6257 RepID=A0A914ZGC0_PARUN
ISSVGSAKCQKLNEYYKRRFFACSQKSGTIYDHAKCIDKVMEAEERLRLSPLRSHKLKMLSKLKSMNEKRIFSRKWIPHEDAIAVSGRKVEHRIYRPKSTRAPKAQPHHDAMWNYWVGSFKQRVKRMVASKADYTLRSPNSHLSVFGLVAKALTKMVRSIKNRTESQTLVSLLIVKIPSTLP